MIKGIYTTANRKPGKPVRWYVYAWRGGPLILSKSGGARPTLGPNDVAKYHAAVANRTSIPAGTIMAELADYRRSEEWKGLAPGTRRTWTGRLDEIETRWGKTPLTVWSDPRMVTKIVAWRNEFAATPRSADHRVGVLRQFLGWLRLRGQVTVNVALGVPQLYGGGDRAEIVWLPEDIAAFEAEADRAGRPHLKAVLRLAACTGLRRDDLAKLTWNDIGPNAIVRLAAKKSGGRRHKAVIPLLPETRQLLAELRDLHRADGVENVLVTSFGKPWTGDGLGGSFNRIRDGAGIVHIDEADDGTARTRKKHLHDVRGTFATKLILAQLTDEEAARILAWSPERVGKIRRVYVDEERVIVALANRIAAA